MIGILWWVWLVALLAFSAIGAVRLRATGGPRYARFIYLCVLGVAVLPLLTGDWIWSLVWLLPGAIIARMMIRRHDEALRRRVAAPPAI